MASFNLIENEGHLGWIVACMYATICKILVLNPKWNIQIINTTTLTSNMSDKLLKIPGRMTWLLVN